MRSQRNEHLLDLIYGVVADPSQWTEVLTQLADHLGALGGMLIYNAPPGERSHMVLARQSEELSAIYRQYYTWNPWTQVMKGTPFGKAVIANSLLTERAISKTAFYADVLAPQGIEDMLAVSHRGMAHNGGIGGISFNLSARGVEQAGKSLRRLQRLTPHLCRALDATLKLGPLADGTRQLERVLQLMPNAALLLDGKGRLIHANPAAEVLLQARDGLALSVDGGLQLSAALPAETAALSKVLARVLAVASGANDDLGEPLRLSRPSGAAPLLVLPVPLPPPAFAFWELLESARVLVLIIDPAAPPRAAAATIQVTFGLTFAEARVAVLIASGLSGPQAAATLGLSPETVKTHLKRCFEKTGVHSQVGLARLLGALPIDPIKPDHAN